MRLEQKATWDVCIEWRSCRKGIKAVNTHRCCPKGEKREESILNNVTEQELECETMIHHNGRSAVKFSLYCENKAAKHGDGIRLQSLEPSQ